MGEVHLETLAYSKFIIHATKYPYCAVNGLLIAENRGKGNKDNLVIVDSVPLFHHSHNLAPMAEIALTKVDGDTQKNNRTIVGYYAACENFYDKTPEKCPSQKIAEKIVEFFPKAVFLVIDNSKCLPFQLYKNETFKAYRFVDSKWKQMESDSLTMDFPDEKLMLQLMDSDLPKMLVDFDNYLDNMMLDWSNAEIEKFVKAELSKSKIVKTKVQCNMKEPQNVNEHDDDEDTSEDNSE